MPTWVDRIDDVTLAAAVDPGTLSRGRDYARRGRVGNLQRLPGEVRANVRGSGRTYVTSVTAYTGRSRTRRFVGSCSCPVSEDCKHAVAVLIAARAARDASTASSDAPSMPAVIDVRDPRPPAPWQRTLTGLVVAARPDAPTASDPAWRPLVLLVHAKRTTVDGYAPLRGGHPLPAVQIFVRPALGDPHGAAPRSAPRSALSWTALASGEVTTADPAQRDAVLALYGLHEAVRPRPSHRGPPLTVPLDECGPGVWALLRRIADAGVVLLPPRDTHRGVVLLDAPVAVVLHATRAGDGGARLRPGVVVNGMTVPADTTVVMGEPSHGVGIVSGSAASGDHQPGTLLIGPLASPLDGAVAAFLRDGDVIRIPAHDVDNFLVEYSPALRRVVHLTTDGSLELPEVGPPRVLLDLTWESGHCVRLGWAFTYRVGDHLIRRPLSPTEDDSATRDAATERKLLSTLLLVPPGPPRAREMMRLGMLDGARLSGMAAVDFLRDDLPRIRAVDGVDVSITGAQPAYREAGEAPVVAVAATDRPGERDWFDLSVTVTVESEPVPFAELFTALARGESHLVLDSGVYLALDHPPLHRLRALIEEAGALVDRPTSGDGWRISRYQASLWSELAALGVVREQSERWAAAVHALLDADLSPAPLPPGVHADLRPYQLAGYQWLSMLRAHGLGGVLADDMGLGKTLQTLAMIARAVEDGEAAPFLVVAPTSVVPAWAQEAARFVPGLGVATVQRTQAKSGVGVAETAADAHVVVTTYALFRLDVEAYQAVPWAGLVLDEAQLIKNHHGRTHQLIRRLPVPVKLALTGTPLENNLMELWALLSVVAPGLYPDPRLFAERFVRPIQEGTDTGQLEVLRRRVRPLMLRRTKEQVAPELPPKQEQVLEVELLPAHRRLYDTHLQRERQKVLRLLDDPQRNQFEILRSLTLLRRLALDPAIVDETYAGVPASKIDVLLDRVREVAQEGHRALVFSQFTSFLASVRARLDQAGLAYAYLDGRTRDRARRVAEFRDGTAPLFLISLKAGGSGLTLTEADYVFLLDPWWNPAVEAQAVDRTHRIGQDRTVMVYRLVATDTIEDKVMALKARKAELFATVMDDGGLPSGPLSADDVRGLLGLS